MERPAIPAAPPPPVTAIRARSDDPTPDVAGDRSMPARQRPLTGPAVLAQGSAPATETTFGLPRGESVPGYETYRSGYRLASGRMLGSGN